MRKMLSFEKYRKELFASNLFLLFDEEMFPTLARDNYERSFAPALRIAGRFDFCVKYKSTATFVYYCREITILMDITITNASPVSLDVCALFSSFSTF